MWEYNLLVFEVKTDGSLDETEASFNSEGAKGWELVTVIPNFGKGQSYCLAIMKRPKK